MDTHATTLDSGSSLPGRGQITFDGRKLIAPKNIVMSVDMLRSYYRNFRGSHYDRTLLYASIEGLIAGNLPYDPQKLAEAGLSHIANINSLDAKALYQRAALTFWNLGNQTENLVVFTLRKFSISQDQDFSGWAEILARNLTKVMKEMWEDFVPQMDILTGQLVKFGLSPIIWNDERDFRWKTVDVSRFYVADQLPITTDDWDCICLSTSYTVQYLYSVYENISEDNDKGWNKKALGDFLIRKANQSMKGGNRTLTTELDMQRAFQDGSADVANVFSDSVELVSALYKEYSGKISHYMFDPIQDGVSDFLFTISEQYESFQEAVLVFTYDPGERAIHGNRGVGHKIYPISQAMMQLDGHILDMAKMASTPIIQSNGVPGKNVDAIRFISGTLTDIGATELKSNDLGSNIPGLISAAQYMEQKVNRNAIIGGDDPGVPDTDRGSKSSTEVQTQAYQEFGVGKQSVAHFYHTLDKVKRNVVIKLMHSKKGYPGYEVAEEWKNLCMEEGVPPEIFSVSDTDKNKLPRHMSVRAARVAGDGSNLGLMMGLNGVAGIAGGFSAKGQYNYRKDVITSRLGNDYVERYLIDSDTPDEVGAGASMATIENIVIKLGNSPQATKDNNHKTHIGTHMALIMETIKGVQSQQIDPITADKMFSLAIPHTGEHVQFLQQDTLNQQFVEQLKGPWTQVQKFAQLNRVKAQKMQQTEIRRRQDEQQEMNADMMEQERKDKVALIEQNRKNKESEAKQERAKEQSDTRAEIMRQGVQSKAENERLGVELKAGNDRLSVQNKNETRKPQDLLAGETTESLQNTLISQVGTTPNPADFK